MCGNVEGVFRNMEDLTPEHAFQFQVLVSCGEQGLLGVLVAVDFIEHGVVDQLTKDGFVTTGHTVTLKEEGVTLGLLHDVVEDNTDLVTEALIVQFVALLEDDLEDSFERRNDLGVSC